MFRQTNAYLVEEAKMDEAAEVQRAEVMTREVRENLDLIADGILDLPASWEPNAGKSGARASQAKSDASEAAEVVLPGTAVTDVPTMKVRTAGVVDAIVWRTALIVESFLMNMDVTEDQRNAAIYRSEALSVSDFYRLSTNHMYNKIQDVDKGDKTFLKDFFRALRGHYWKSNFAWVGIEREGNRPELAVLECKAPLFFGVENSNNRVVGIDLSANALDGPLPDSIIKAKGIQFLNLNFNKILGRLPRGVTALSDLEVLTMAANRLQGPLDVTMLQALKKLRVLDLSFNMLSGSIPDAFHDMVNLQDLNLAGNQLSGELPPSMASLTQLEYFKLHNNRLQGVLPNWISRFSKLKELNLSQNNFSGPLDPVYHCNALNKLILCHNNFKCELKPAIGKLVELRVLYISYNSLFGRITDGICELVHLTNLNLSHNNFGGVLPREFGEMEHLKVCILGHNNITGPAPPTLHKLIHTLQDFELFTCYPSDCMTIPRAFESHTFKRIFAWGPSVHLNNVVWDERLDKTVVGSRYEPPEVKRDYDEYTAANQSGRERPRPKSSRSKSPKPR